MPVLQFLAPCLIVLWASLHLVQSQGFSGDCVNLGSDGPNIFYTISEDFPVDETIGVLDIQGTAGSSNPTISLELVSSNDGKCTEYISLDIYTKALNLTKPLERDGPDGMTSLSCTVKCRPLSNPNFIFDIEHPITIIIGDINDNTPQFEGLPYHVEISELTLVSSTIFNNLLATDADSGRNGSVSYFVVNNPEDPDADEYFINNLPAMGIVTLNKTLDYETKTEWHVLIEARDRAVTNPKVNTTILTVTVIDGDDLGPQFVPCIEVNNVCTTNTYKTHIPEKQAITAPLVFSPGPVYAEDQDKDVPNPSTIKYSFNQGNPAQYQEYFEINANGGNITLKKPVDRSLFQLFRIVVKAEEMSSTSTGRYATANIEIYIDDVNDNKPNFTQRSYSGFVNENAGLGTTVVTTAMGTMPLQVEAVDPDVDQGVSPQLDYRFIGADDRFAPSKVGDIMYIVVSGSLDRETNSSYSFSVIATETATNETLESDPVPVTVTILDVNDNPPVFATNAYSTDVNRYRVRVKENKQVGSSIMTLSASDSDLGDNAVIDFTISYVANGDSDLFGIEQGNNTATLTLTKAELEPREEYTVTVKAEDRGPETNRKSTLAFVTVDVQPLESSRAPVFAENPFLVSVSESNPPQVIKTVTATDGDGDTVYYNVSAGDPNGEFTISELGGEVSIVNELDRERQASYNLTITATDLNQTVTTQLLVTVLDINDNNPEFNSTWPSTFYVFENVQNAYVGEVQAYDIDEPNTPNSEVEYLLDSPRFSIESSSGMIHTKVALDREEESLYELIVTAQDKATSPRSSTTTVTVVVQDQNDHGPIFDPSYYQYTITENVMEGDFLTVEATDNDEGAILSYEITSGNTSVFSVHNQTGSLSLLVALDYEMVQTYSLTVTATDIHQTDMSLASADAVVTITVMDVNDNPPVFTQDEYRGSVKENADLGTTVIDSILATDGDLPETLNGQVTYQIEPPNEFFTISDPQTGVIVTKTSLKRTTQDEYHLTVKAYDSGDPSERLSDTTTVIIEITDREEVQEKPVFEKSVYSVSDLLEEQPSYTPVVEVRAVGRAGDSVSYQIVSGNHNDSFLIESVDNVGQILTNRVLDREDVSMFTLTVLASVYNNTNTTSGRRRRADEPNVAEVIIELKDINDNPPQFTQSKYVGGVADDASPFTEVLQILVTDVDSDENSQVNFTMGPLNSTEETERSFFQIDINTGMITTTDVLNRQLGSTRKYQFVVVARDTAGGFSTEASVVISLISNENRVVLVADVPPTLIEENKDKVVELLELILNATVVIERIGPREYGNEFSSIDPSGTDILFYAVDENDNPLTTVEIMRILEAHSEELDELFRSFLNGGIISIRPPENTVVKNYQMQTTEAALIALGCILFLLSCIAIIVICYSWKQREAEKQRNARLYLPMYTNITAYDSNNASDISHIRMPEPVPNPVFLDDQAIQVDDLYPNGEPHFLKAYEAQEFTMDFFADPSEVGEGEEFSVQVDPESSVVLPYRDHTLEAISEQSEPSHGSTDKLASLAGNRSAAEGMVNPALEENESDDDDDIKKPPVDEEEEGEEEVKKRPLDEVDSTLANGATLATAEPKQNGKVITPNGRVHTNPSNTHRRGQNKNFNPSDVSSNHVNHKPKGNIRSFEQREQDDTVRHINGRQYVLNPTWNRGHTLSAQGVTILDETEQDDLREAIMLKNSGLGLWMLEDVQSTAL